MSASLPQCVNSAPNCARSLTNKLTEVQESERRQIARELHDEMGQALTALRINLAAVEKALPPNAPLPSRERLGEAIGLAEQTLEPIGVDLVVCPRARTGSGDSDRFRNGPDRCSRKRAAPTATSAATSAGARRPPRHGAQRRVAPPTQTN